MFEFIALCAIIINLFILNNIFDKLKRIDRTVEKQKDILNEIKLNETKSLEYNPTNNSLALNKLKLETPLNDPHSVITKEEPGVQSQSLNEKLKISNSQNSSQIENEEVYTPTQNLNSTISNAQLNDKVLASSTKESQSNIIDKAINWIKDGFLIKIGGILLLLSGIWFLSIGFSSLDSNGRIASGLFAGFSLVIIGVWQMNKRLIFGQVLELLGSSIVLIAILSARFNYSLEWMTPLTAFAGCVFVVTINTLIAILKNSRPIGFLSLILGYLAPFFAVGTEYNFFALMLYVLVFNISMLLVSFYKKWNFLLLPNIIFSSIYLTGYGLTEKDRVAVWIYAVIFMTVFYITTIFNQIKKPKLSGLDIFNSFFATFVGFGWINLFVDGDWKTIVVALYAIFTFVVAAILYRSKSPNEFVYMQLTTAFVSLIYATFLLFGNQYDYTLVAVSLELTGSQFLISSILNKKSPTQRIIGLFQILPLFSSILVLLFGIANWGNILTGLILVLCAVLNSIIFFGKFNESKEVDLGIFAKVFGIVAFFMAIRWVWVLFEQIFEVDSTRSPITNQLVSQNVENIKQTTLAHGGALTVMTICAILLISRVIKVRSEEQKFLGYSLIGFVLLRLVLVEITMMDTTLKIITFAAIGILLTLTAFIRKEN